MKNHSYIELINRFWDYSRIKHITLFDTAVYFYLLNECNIRRWLNPFELQTRNLEADLQITRKTIGEVRNRLKQRGLIDFIEAKGRGPTMYLIDGIAINNEALSDIFCVSSEKHKVNTTVTQSKHNGNTKVTQTQNAPIILEDIKTIDIKDRKEKIKESDAVLARQISFFENEKKEVLRKEVKSKSSQTLPTLDEVKTYFLSQGAAERLENWEESAGRFYNNFNAVGWRDKFNRRITRWESRANSWILDDEQREKNKETNGKFRTQSYVNPDRRGTEADAKKEKDWYAPF